MKLSEFKKGQLVQCIQDGLSIRKAAKKFGISHTGAAKIFRQNTSSGDVSAQQTSGRKKKIGVREARLIARKASQTPNITSKTIARQFSNGDFGGKTVELSARTVRRSLNESGLIASVKRKRPKLDADHKKARLAFCRAHANWSESDWEKVIFSDETRINLLGSDGRKYSWRRPNAPLRDCDVRPTRLFGGGGVMVWACFGFQGVGYAAKLSDGLDAELYCRIINEELSWSLDYCVSDPQDFFFQQDNAAAHKAFICRDLFEEKNIRVMNFPSRSPDLNPIENLWSIVKSKVHRRGSYSSKDALWEAFEKEWESIEPALCRKLVHSMTSRVRAVIKAKGGYTNY